MEEQEFRLVYVYGKENEGKEKGKKRARKGKEGKERERKGGKERERKGKKKEIKGKN